MSATGRYIAFSTPDNDILGDSHHIGIEEIFVHDRTLSNTWRVSVATNGTRPNASAFDFAISANGRFVTFSSHATNLVTAPTTGNTPSLFLHAWETGETILIAPSSGGASISEDGSLIAFLSQARLLESDTDNVSDIYLYERETHELALVSVGYDGTESFPFGSGEPVISADGSIIVFNSGDRNLVADDTNGKRDIFVYDRQSTEITRVTMAFDGSEANGDSQFPTISADGRFVGFSSYAGNLVDTTLPNGVNPFVYDRQTDKTTHFPVPLINQLLFSADGRFITFSSYADNIVPNDENGVSDVFTTERASAPPQCDSALVQKFAPAMYFHQDDPYRPIGVDRTIENALLVNGDNRNQTKPALPEDLATFNTAPNGQFPNGWRNLPNAFLDLAGHGAADIRNFYMREIRPFESPSLFARIICPKSTIDVIVIQYWFFYYDNDWVNHHEGDWEMVQVVLDTQARPIYAAYSQHKPYSTVGGITIYTGGSKRLWKYVEKTEDNKPIVYVGRGSHASFFKPYDYTYLSGFFSDHTTPISSDSPVSPSVQILPVVEDATTWLYFEGRWGNIPLESDCEYDCGPPGPSQRSNEWNNQWDAPLSWVGAIPWDEDANHYNTNLRVSIEYPRDVELHHRATGQVVKYNQSDIPDAEYFDNPITNRRTIILHNEQMSSLGWPYEVRIPLRNSQARNSSLENDVSDTIHLTFPDITSGRIISAEYILPPEWGSTSEVIVQISPDSDLRLQADIDGDGQYETQVEPQISEQLYDFQPPAKVEDLQAVEANGKVHLQWTATGDDSQIGTAARYVLRHGTMPIDESNWHEAWSFEGALFPSSSGITESIELANVPRGKHYFALRVLDDVGWQSELSNSVMVQINNGDNEQHNHVVYLPLVQE